MVINKIRLFYTLDFFFEKKAPNKTPAFITFRKQNQIKYGHNIQEVYFSQDKLQLCKKERQKQSKDNITNNNISSLNKHLTNSQANLQLNCSVMCPILVGPVMEPILPSCTMVLVPVPPNGPMVPVTLP
jgi:hypothetical protein